MPVEAGTTLPACTGGERACPPEDCGGVHGYKELVAVLADRSHPEHQEMLAWAGGSFDADAFDPAGFSVNR